MGKRLTFGRSNGSALSQAVIKAVSIFGGVQVITILCSILRAKLVSIWIGPVGVGLLAIYLGAMELIRNISQLNLGNSAVRDISCSDKAKLPLIISSVRWCGRWLGIVGFVLMIVVSPLLSRWTFGDWSHWWGFALCSITLLFLAPNSAQLSILQGLKMLKPLAKASLWGAVTTIIFSIPLFFFLREQSIIPVVIIGGVCALACSYFVRYKGQVPPLGFKENFNLAKGFLALGFYMTITSVLNQLSSYALISFLNDNYDTVTVGLYRAGFTLANSYVGMVFTAIGMEYYPRLSSQIKYHNRSCVLVSHEISLSLWILMPLVCIFIGADHLIVTMLYSGEFVDIVPYITLAMVGIMLRAASWCMAFVILAKGDGRTFLITEGISEVLYYILSLTGFKFLGFYGLGMAYTIWYAIYITIIWIVYRHHYHMHLGQGITKLILFSVVFTALAILGKFHLGWWLPLIMALAIAPYSYRRLRL